MDTETNGGRAFRFLSHEEFELLEQREKLAYLERALNVLRNKPTPGPKAPEVLLRDEPSGNVLKLA